MKVTLKDIANRAEVSISTVSRVLSDTPVSIHDGTRLRIIQAAKELGYFKINNSLQNKNNQEKRVGVVLSKAESKYRDPFFSEIIYGIERELIEQGCVLEFTYDMQEIVQSNLLSQINKNDLGIVCVGPFKEEILRKLTQQIPAVLFVGGTTNLEIDHVTVDFHQAAMNATNYLIHKGHTDIAYIGGSPLEGLPHDQEDRFLGFKKALQSNNLSINQEWVQDGGFDLTRGYEAMKRILNTGRIPTALFSASDRMAFGAYKAIQEYGLSIPEDISIISFDDIEMSEFITPPLTTVRVFKEEMGRIAVKLLIQKMEGSITLPLTSFLPTKLIVRNSCMNIH
ncbi:LacI family DNA-binding transcriptional regulator [Bacillus sp. SD088]|uniref:LacI family DNA-binding transcriptional regulator n=1 Tax=Bacillus sp. SD088 TaxID=2782012 RepID=UPI001A95A760|nr:LacI family DNA-binding transcriptional regulator [Bacillus sp. SD088]MBO0994319.1 LacI family DNA-binding transcriptional regulator [Bacillus sp. SD088]